MKKINWKAFVVGTTLACVGSLSATELSCYSATGGERGMPSVKCSMDVSVNEADGFATAKFNGQSDDTRLDRADDNLAEFKFTGGAEAGIWEKEAADGSKSWSGFILPSEDDAFCRVKCVKNTNLAKK